MKKTTASSAATVSVLLAALSLLFPLICCYADSDSTSKSHLFPNASPFVPLPLSAPPHRRCSPFQGGFADDCQLTALLLLSPSISFHTLRSISGRLSAALSVTPGGGGRGGEGGADNAPDLNLYSCEHETHANAAPPRPPCVPLSDRIDTDSSACTSSY